MVEPRQLIDPKALVGDKSDNIPGVSGVGEKGATQLLQTWGVLDSIYTHLDDVTLSALATRLPNSGMWPTSHELWVLLWMFPAWNWT